MESVPPSDSQSRALGYEQCKGKTKPFYEGKKQNLRPLVVSLDNADTVIEGAPSWFSLRRGLETPPPTDDLLKFCQKELDILTNWEHYDPTLGREISLFGPLRTTPRNPFRGVGDQVFSCKNLGRELLHGAR